MFYNKKIERFKRHLKKFIEGHNLFKFKKIYVAVSGGKDSMALLSILHELKNELHIELYALHVNHGTRSENEQEESGIRSFCEQLKVPLRVKKLKLTNGKNFEAEARSERYKFFKEALPHHAHLVTAHTIDDSFEWSMMTSFKSASTKSSLGIPLKRGKIVRPFHAFTREMVEFYILKRSIPYFDDPTNSSLIYERNYIRHQVVPQIKAKYPKFLKHYVERQNSLAMKMGFHLLSSIGKHQPIREKYGTVVQVGGDPITLKDCIRDEIINYSNKERGELISEINKLLQAIDNRREGPMSFSGGVKVFIAGNKILITNDKLLEFFIEADRKLAKSIENSQIPMTCLFFPFWKFVEGKVLRKRSHPLWPLSIKAAVEKNLGIYYQL